jgi:hypothetical protein
MRDKGDRKGKGKRDMELESGHSKVAIPSGREVKHSDPRAFIQEWSKMVAQ